MCDENSRRPETPPQEDCCGNDCNPCIFDVHKNLLERWKNNKNLKPGKRKNILAPTAYKLFSVTELVELNSDYLTICINYTDKEEKDRSIIIQPGQHVILSYYSWSKPFTPISWTDDSLRFLVRIYKDGIFTNRIKKFNIGEEIKVRGPFGDFQYKRNSFLKILMFGIGSGLAAIHPIAKSITDDELEESKIHLVAGFSSVDQVPLKKELQLLTDFWNFQCTLYLSKYEDEPMARINGISLKPGRINEAAIKNVIKENSPAETLILICGNKQFNKSVETLVKDSDFTNYHVFQ